MSAWVAVAGVLCNTRACMCKLKYFAFRLECFARASFSPELQFCNCRYNRSLSPYLLSRLPHSHLG
jgi:hypothetical protein